MKLGKAFSDNVVSVNRYEHTLTKDVSDAWWLGAGRVLIFTICLFTAFFVLGIRLFDLSIIHGHQNRVLAEANRIRELVRHAPRGILRDRTGQPLVENVVKYRLLKPCQAGGPVVGGCVQILSKEEGEALSASGLPSGSFLETDYRRLYRFPESIAHVTGYTSEVSATELSQEYYQLRGYRPGDQIGRMGAESVFEDRLRGRDGKELVEVDSQARVLRMLGRDPEISGSDVILSLDLNLTDIVAKAFPVSAKGAVVVTKPSTGEILALYSSPSFDPNAFSEGMSSEQYRFLTSSPDQPMFNRAISGQYPPGSTFKLVTALAGLESGTITPDTLIEDTGVIKVGQFSFANWYFTQYGRTEGAVNLVRGITRSNDIYFYKVGEKIGIDTLAEWARKVGVGTLTGIELSGESAGIMPDRLWKSKQFTSPADLEARNNLWYDGDTYHVAIGQGYLLTTPLQVNLWTNAVATGYVCRPTIDKVSSGKGHQAVCRNLNLHTQTREKITEGMVGACDEGGTGWPLFGFGTRKLKADGSAVEGKVEFTRIPVACKTGTSEFGDPQKRTHAWFTVFAPVPDAVANIAKPVSGQTGIVSGDPEISITVLIEAGGEGSNVAAPIAKNILEYWFNR